MRVAGVENQCIIRVNKFEIGQKQLNSCNTHKNEYEISVKMPSLQMAFFFLL